MAASAQPQPPANWQPYAERPPVEPGRPPEQWQAPAMPARPRVFPWFFLAVQVVFLVWAVGGAVSSVPLWLYVDVLLGVGYVVYRLLGRP